MHRTQILLDSWQYERMKNLAEREGRSLSSLVREAVTAFLDRKAERASTKVGDVAGIGDDPDCRGRDHDEFLYRPRRDPS